MNPQWHRMELLLLCLEPQWMLLPLWWSEVAAQVYHSAQGWLEHLRFFQQ